MIGEKPWYLSRTIWGSLVSVAAAIGAAAGMQLDGHTHEEIVQALVQLCGAAGSLFAIYGRFSASERIT